MFDATRLNLIGVEWIRFYGLIFDPGEIGAKEISQGRQDLQDFVNIIDITFSLPRLSA